MACRHGSARGGSRRETTSDELGRLFKRVIAIAVELDKTLAARHDLALTDLGCLGFLETAQGPVTGKMISEHVALSTGATTALLDRLERAGLIERRPNPADRRGIVIDLVAANAKPILDEHRHMRDRLWATFDSLSEDEAATVTKFLNRLIDRFEA
ncbi:MarR family transcriptional regulator [Fulvimarina sp. 2208YS6-2-32]|uniref:MarR family transcriptional regulator n=1 Tax=Fulvimarina uroteuthidis TaxID=3098149 RepID=A0ABU5I6W9_9HYPH|nr:MarR family transcriptional regulator [Fulvimarina sp. 2208YS6-2-32]MDY8111112.1 MarR family transcriptional regulator [Fulvimarina sp. 2208YS6-2-32]